MMTRGRMPTSRHPARFVSVALLAVPLSFGAVLAAASVPAQAQIMLRDLVSIEGVRSNQLVGYGLVVGLQGTGDTLRNSQFTQQSLTAMLERMGVNVTGSADCRPATPPRWWLPRRCRRSPARARRWTCRSRRWATPSRCRAAR